MSEPVPVPVLRTLRGDADADAVLGIRGPWEREWVRHDFSAPEHVAWWGLENAPGQLVAVHRAVRWGSALLLCGAYVAPGHRTGPVLLRLVRAAHDVGEQLGVTAVTAWSEPGAPHDLGPVARRCGLRSVGPPVNRYLGTVTVGPAPDGPRADALAGTHAGRPWTVNGGRVTTDVVVDPTTVRRTSAALDELAGRTRRRRYEVLASAGDLVGDLELRHQGLVRVNRYPAVLLSTRSDWHQT